MAQVTMSNQEYNALQRKADMLDKLFNQLVDGYVVQFDEDSSWRPVSIELNPKFEKTLEQRIATGIADKLATREKVMDWLVKEEEYIFDVPKSCTCKPSWEKRLYIGQYDMRELSEAFKEAWQEAEERARAQAEAEDKEAEEEEAKEEEA